MTDFESIKNTLYDNEVYDAWQFVINTAKTIQTAEYCKNQILALITQMGKEHDDWMSDLFSQLSSENSKEKIITITSDNLPQHKVNVAEIEVDSHFLIQKLTKDFFQYSRNAFDSISQIGNAAILAFKHEDIERVDFGFMSRTFNQKHNGVFQEVQDWYSTVEQSDEYKYLDAFCNRTKHICDVYLHLSMALIGGENKAVINPFYKKKAQQQKQDLNTYLSEILSFVQNSFDDFMDIVIREVPKKIYVQNRIHKACIQQQKRKDDPESDYAVIYIDEKPTVETMPDEIEVLFLRKDNDGDISSKNCEFDTIYIRKAGVEHNYVGKYVAQESYGDDTLVKYRKYAKIIAEPDKTPLLIEALLEWKKNKKFYHANAFLDVRTVSDDEAFLKRVCLPF